MGWQTPQRSGCALEKDRETDETDRRSPRIKVCYVYPKAPRVIFLNREQVRGPWYLHAESLDERLAALRRPGASLPRIDRSTARRRLQSWKGYRAFSSTPERFKRRLAAGGLTEAELTTLLGAEPSSYYGHYSPPQWVHRFTRPAADTFAQTVPPTLDDYMERGLIAPFYPQLLHYCSLLSGNVQALAARCRWLSDSAACVEALVGSFLPGLERNVRRAVVLDVNVLRMRGELRGETASQRFASYRDSMREAHRRAYFYAKYPVLARYVQIALDFWLDNSIEILTRLADDYQLISEAFGLSAYDRLMSCDSSGDTHALGRAVAILTFESGEKLVYKPRGLGLDVRYQEFLSWFSDLPCGIRHRTLSILDRADYGWVEYAKPIPASSDEEFNEFYRRLGSLICLLHVLYGVDIHFENIVSAGGYPIVVDVETLFHPEVTLNDCRSASDAVRAQIRASVMRIGVLPRPTATMGGATVFDISAIGASVDQKAPYTVVGIENFGRDDVRITDIQGWIPSAHNRPDPTCKKPIPGDTIRRGFVETYEALLSHKDRLMAASGPMTRFRTLRRRLIVRDTVRYGGLQADEFHPDLLRDAIDRDWHWDNLWNDAVGRPVTERFLRSEIAQAQRYDIPHFTALVDGHEAFGSDGSVIDISDMPSGWEAVQERLFGLGEADLDQQCWYLSTSLGLREGRVHARVLHRPNADHLDTARAIGDAVLRRLCIHEETASFASVSSIGMRGPDSALAFAIDDADGALYDGRAGVALFLATLGSLTDGVEYKTAAARLIRNTEVQTGNPAQGLGGFTGLPSLIYAYAHLAGLLQEPGYVRDAEALLDRCEALLPSDTAFDVLNGAAGCILAMLSLHSISPASRALCLAHACANHILGEPPRLDAAWRRLSVKRGFSHGLSGVAFSIMRLAEVTGDRGLTAKAIEIFASESRLLADGKWTDSHQVDGRDQVSWCHGAPGIALARIALQQESLNESMRADLNIAIEETGRHFRMRSHCLCHGSLGNLEPLLMRRKYAGTAGETIDDKISVALSDFASNGFESLIANQANGIGLMTGLSGVGYALLRLKFPEVVPSVLVLEPPRAVLATRRSGMRRSLLQRIGIPTRK